MRGCCNGWRIIIYVTVNIHRIYVDFFTEIIKVNFTKALRQRMKCTAAFINKINVENLGGSNFKVNPRRFLVFPGFATKTIFTPHTPARLAFHSKKYYRF